MRIPKRVSFFFLTIACLSLATPAQEITRSGRRIQLDGFLMDWIEKDRRAWSVSPEWFWDAINTPEGVSGYFHSPREQCALWNFYVDPSRLKARPWEIAVPDTADAGNPFFLATHAAKDSVHALTIEWVIPWDSVAVDSSGRYAIRLAGFSSCGDTLAPLLLTGSLYSMAKHSWLPPRFAERVLLIIFLLVVFIVLQLKVRKRTPRRGSPRR